ncbi:MAG: undecaprenyl-diphosphate phosphatase [Candidatus Zipacnadales bacterium]
MNLAISSRGRSTFAAGALRQDIGTVLLALWGVCVCSGVVKGQTQAKESSPPRLPLPVGHALVLGVTEGLTEYLPVSSTGHLCLVERLLGVGATTDDKPAADAYAIAIQLGAILAVIGLYWRQVLAILKGIVGRSPEGLRLALNLLVAFIPAAVAGLLAEPIIKRYLFGLWPITVAWLIGGVVILLTARRWQPASEGRLGLGELRPSRALLIGLAQLMSMWPGISRSLATILGGYSVGLSIPAAVEFSFLLGLVTLGAATCKEIATSGQLVVATFGYGGPLIGLLAALVSATAAVKWMIAYVTKHGLAVFGYYRILLAIIVGAWLLIG